MLVSHNDIPTPDLHAVCSATHLTSPRGKLRGKESTLLVEVFSAKYGVFF